MGKLEEYLSLPYPIKIIKNDDGTFFAEIEELHGCMTDGAESVEEAYKMIHEAKEAWLYVALKKGIEIQKPVEPETMVFSGRVTLRISKSLHRQLAETSNREGVTLNTWLITLIERGEAGNYYCSEIKEHITRTSENSRVQISKQVRGIRAAWLINNANSYQLETVGSPNTYQVNKEETWQKTSRKALKNIPCL